MGGRIVDTGRDDRRCIVGRCVAVIHSDGEGGGYGRTNDHLIFDGIKNE